MNSLRDFARKVGVGPLLRHAYHVPVATLRRSFLEGGPWQQRQTEIGRQAMLAAAASLPPLTRPVKDNGLRVSFLTGERYWHQTVFCAYSLQLNSHECITPVLHDDGTLSAEFIQHVRCAIPWTEVCSLADTEMRVNEALPASQFPTLRSRRAVFPLMRKLVDIHAGRTGWRLFLDSDMLFFREPKQLLDWLRQPEQPLHMVDVKSFYGYSDALMQELAGGSLKPAVNSGIFGLPSETLNWPQIEAWCRTMETREGPDYLEEQALVALIMSTRPSLAIAKNDYLVLPGLDEGRDPEAVLHHYVAQSKRLYFQYGWQRVVASARARADAPPSTSGR